MGQISMEILRRTGSALSGNQQASPFPLRARSKILHPVLQDHVDVAMGRGRDTIENDFELQLVDAQFAKQQRMLVDFFDSIPEILELLRKAAADTKETAKNFQRDRKRGAPSNRAGEWAMTRIMWIWRDVLGHDINIYVRRISGRVEQAAPEPNACVSFVQRVMERIDPQMLPAGAQNLERKLIALRPKVPAAPLIFDPSRKN